MIRMIVAIAMAVLLAAPALARGTMVPAGTPHPDAQLVSVGFLPLALSSINIAESSYYLDGYLWFRWSGNNDPSRTYEIINVVDRSNFHESRTYPVPIVLEGGERYQIIRIAGWFHQPFDLSAFPLDTQRLSIMIEDQQHTIEELFYVPDLESSGLSGTLTAGNWAIAGWSLEALRHNYGTDFGAGEGEEIYALLNFSVEIDRPARYFIWKLLLPLCVLLGAALASSLMHRRADVRVSVPVLVLLATVVLQQSYSSTLPEVGYLVLMDQIFVLAFIIIMATAVRAVWTASRVRRVEESGASVPSNAAMLRLDAIYCAIMLGAFVIGTTLIVVLR